MVDLPFRVPRSVRIYFTLETWTWLTPTEYAHRRSTWPTWRRAIRPVGATACWLTWPASHLPDPARLTIGLPLLAVVLCCFVIGNSLELHDRRRQGHLIGV